MAAKTKPQASAKPGNEFLSAEQAANRYGVHRASIYRWAKEGDFPTPIKLGPNVTRWALADLEAWEQSQREAC
ncbi:helix-turn-helix transcriptional regulator [Vreelandella nigrificans]|uniref:AlpA family transcriptional regulator n=1 Tax=Vreelandella nigrificans TaxID=2042704 RepID=A0A2A4HUA7_9GAMM|nr:AlpA family phage regulatory protein [Halomonas nigrificans]PCF97663.1 AlpA family transcriptional regulator [Halomonas nigrificans]